MTERQLGKISKAVFGFGGYQDAQIGLTLVFDFKGSGCHAFIGGGWNFAPSDHAKWTLEDQTKTYAEMTRKIIQLMKDAKVDDVMGLVGKPIEATFEAMTLKDWRILTEVI
jgi:hypothetical protein